MSSFCSSGSYVTKRTGRLLIYLACATTDPHRAGVIGTDELTELRWVDLDLLDALMPDLLDQVRGHLDRGRSRRHR